jgi:hypothetical protein
MVSVPHTCSTSMWCLYRIPLQYMYVVAVQLTCSTSRCAATRLTTSSNAASTSSLPLSSNRASIAAAAVEGGTSPTSLSRPRGWLLLLAAAAGAAAAPLRANLLALRMARAASSLTAGFRLDSEPEGRNGGGGWQGGGWQGGDGFVTSQVAGSEVAEWGVLLQHWCCSCPQSGLWGRRWAAPVWVWVCVRACLTCTLTASLAACNGHTCMA